MIRYHDYAANQITKYLSPDGQLTLLVISEPDDITIGFEGFPWHTHGDILALRSGTLDYAVANFVADILEDRSVICVTRVAGVITDVHIQSRYEGNDKYQSVDETVEWRYWGNKKSIKKLNTILKD